MDFLRVLHKQALRKTCSAKPMDLTENPLFVNHDYKLWRIKHIKLLKAPFGPPAYDLTCHNGREEISITAKEETLLQQLILPVEIPVSYPEFLI